MRAIFISWGRESEKSKYLSKGIGAEFNQIYIKKIWFIPLPTIIRYIVQSIMTFVLLIKKRPEVVCVQNPPVFAPIVSWLYCLIFRSRLAIDSHTAAFLDKKWRFFFPLFRFVAKRADLNTAHNYKNLEILEKWGIEPAFVLQNYNPKYDLGLLQGEMKNQDLAEKAEKSELPIFMVNRFANDDDWQTVFRAAELMKEATFFVTGSVPKDKNIKETTPSNVVLTGYLNHDDFMRLMWRSRVVLAFTSREDTVLWSIREIMALRKPFITSDTEVLRHYFGEVGLFVKSDSEKLAKRIKEAVEEEDKIKKNIDEFIEKDNKRWEGENGKVRKILKLNKESN